MSNNISARFASGAGTDDGSSSSALLRERKSGLSCAECRRSKLKCDRVFPCQSCIRRGCGNICPDGVLAATKGNKVLMARADKLAAQVKSMSTRIADLERALAEADARAGTKTNPLLVAQLPVKWEDSDDIDAPSDSEDEVASAASPPPSGGLDDGAYISPTAQYLKTLPGPPRHEHERISPYQTHQLGLPQEIAMLVNAFPLGPSEPHVVTKAAFLPFIPPRPRASQLAEIYYSYTIIYRPVSLVDFRAVLDSVYGPGDGPASVEHASAHRLSLFFIVMCFGTFFEDQPFAHPAAESFHALSRAAMAIESPVHIHTIDTVQALFLINIYKLLSSRPSTEWRWIISGICVRISQTMALQRDCAVWVTDPEEIQQRRVVFWEIFVFEAWTGVLSSRPPGISARHTNCRFPEDRETVEHNGKTEMGFHAWKYRYTSACLSPTVQHVFNVRNQTYGMLLDIDAQIRRFPVPVHLRTPLDDPPTPWSADEHTAMKQEATIIMIDGTLLYLHRAYLPLIPSGGSAQQHKLGRSIWASYRSASRMIRSLKSLYAAYPERTGRVWYFWGAVYSAFIALGSLAIERPFCQLARHAHAELEAALPVYEEGSANCAGPATREILRGLVERVRASAAAAAERDPNPGCSDDCCARCSPAEVADFAYGRHRWSTPSPADSHPVLSPSGSGSGGGGGGGGGGGDMGTPPVPAAAPGPSTLPTAIAEPLYAYLGHTPNEPRGGGGLVPPTPPQVRFPPPPHPAQREAPHIALQPISYPYGLQLNPVTQLPQWQYAQGQQQYAQHHTQQHAQQHQQHQQHPQHAQLTLRHQQEQQSSPPEQYGYVLLPPPPTEQWSRSPAEYWAENRQQLDDPQMESIRTKVWNDFQGR